MEPIGRPETSVTNYQYSLRNNPEERSSQLLRGGSLKSRFVELLDQFQVRLCAVLLFKVSSYYKYARYTAEHLTDTTRKLARRGQNYFFQF
jgi:hypothetical protein